MSKTKKIKQKTTGFDIVYRVVTAIMAIAAFPLAYFSKMILIVIMHEEVSNIINNLTGSEDPGGTYAEWSIADIFDSSSTLHMILNLGEGNSLSISTIWDNVYLRAVLIAAIFFAITLVLALIILFFAIFSNKSKVIIGLSASGVLSMIVSFVSFTQFFANPIINGDVSLANILNINGIIANLALGLINITTIKLEGAFFWVFFLMLGILVWSIAVLVVNKSEEKEKAMKAAARKNN